MLGDDELNFINIVNPSTHEFIKSQGFNCFKEIKVGNENVYLYSYNDEIVKLLNTKFTKKDYFVNNKMNF